MWEESNNLSALHLPPTRIHTVVVRNSYSNDMLASILDVVGNLYNLKIV
jgi:hypothetical protein